MIVGLWPDFDIFEEWLVPFAFFFCGFVEDV